jgi:SAM-dependent methyltransferase
MHKKNYTHPWEREYQNPQFLTLGTEPLADVKDFFRWMKKQVRKNAKHFSAPLDTWTVLDLGCGNGKNLVYAVENFCASGIGYDISQTAIQQALALSQKLLEKNPTALHYEIRSIGQPVPLTDQSVDLIIDATSSHCLHASEREIYLREIYRVLKPNGWLFVRALCLDGDNNAKKLIQDFPGSEPQSYVVPQTNITETVFTEKQLMNNYASFQLEYSEKKSGYQKWGNQPYKRNYWIGYFKK